MAQCVVYPSPEGGLSVLYPTAESTPEQILAVLPEGPHLWIDTESLPQNTKYQRAWIVDWEAESPEVEIDPAIAEEIDREDALAALEDWFIEVTRPGVEVAEGIRLGMSQQDVTLLTGYYVLAKEAAALELPIPPLMDINGAPHEIADIATLTGYMLAYGQARAQISAEYATKKAAIMNPVP